MLQQGTRIATPAEIAGTGHFHHNRVEERRQQLAAHRAAKAAGMAEKLLNSKKARRRRPLHEVNMEQFNSNEGGCKLPKPHFQRRPPHSRRR